MTDGFGTEQCQRQSKTQPNYQLQVCSYHKTIDLITASEIY